MSDANSEKINTELDRLAAAKASLQNSLTSIGLLAESGAEYRLDDIAAAAEGITPAEVTDNGNGEVAISSGYLSQPITIVNSIKTPTSLAFRVPSWKKGRFLDFEVEVYPFPYNLNLPPIFKTTMLESPDMFYIVHSSGSWTHVSGSTIAHTGLGDNVRGGPLVANLGTDIIEPGKLYTIWYKWCDVATDGVVYKGTTSCPCVTVADYLFERADEIDITFDNISELLDELNVVNVEDE